MNKFPLSKQTLLLLLVIVILGVQNFFLASQNNELLDKNIMLLREMSRRETLQPGDTLTSFAAYTGDSVRTSIGLTNGKKTLLFVFTTWCGICKQNWSSWETIRDKSDSTRTEILMVSPENPSVLRPYEPLHHFGRNYVCAASDSSVIRSLKIMQYPQTILIGSDGIVEQSWSGALSSYDVREIITISSKFPLP